VTEPSAARTPSTCLTASSAEAGIEPRLVPLYLFRTPETFAAQMTTSEAVVEGVGVGVGVGVGTGVGVGVGVGVVPPLCAVKITPSFFNEPGADER